MDSRAADRLADQRMLQSVAAVVREELERLRLQVFMKRLLERLKGAHVLPCDCCGAGDLRSEIGITVRLVDAADPTVSIYEYWCAPCASLGTGTDTSRTGVCTR